MPITDQYARLPLDAIYIDRDKRQRRLVDSKGLRESIGKNGVLNPIIVTRETNQSGQHRLTAGERRLNACTELGLPNIPVRFADELTPREAAIFELEENIKRENLPWQDQARAIEHIHSLYRQEIPSWTQEETGEQLFISKGLVSIYLNLAKNLDKEEIASKTTLKEAYNVILRTGSRERAQIIDELMQPLPSETKTKSPTAPMLLPPSTGQVVRVEAAPREPLIPDPAKTILLESFIQWAPRYSGPKFNMIHCDFPYGIGVFDGPQSGADRHHSYSDTKEIHFKLLECLLVNLNRLASESCHIMYWFSMHHYDQIRQMLADLAPDLVIHTHPLIWHKTDNVGIAADPRREPRHIYETALFLTRGRRQVVKLVGDVYAAPTDRTWGIHTKPVPMLKHFFNMLVDEFTLFLDPTCGSGSAVRAAEELKAKLSIGMDIDEATVGRARMALRHDRVMRGAHSTVAAE